LAIIELVDPSAQLCGSPRFDLACDGGADAVAVRRDGSR
jgi:hypothetical protein